jgi:hypothetical protein
MGSLLDVPASAEDLWLAVGDVPVARPLMQGDIVLDLPLGVDGSPAPGMVLTHPCSMRAGRKLRQLQTVGQVVAMDIPDERWPDGYFDYMPLPDIGLPDMPSSAVDFRLVAAVPTPLLTSHRRFACLSETGVQLLQQRLAHHLTRVVVDLPILAEHSASVLLEAELQEEWGQAALAQAGDESAIEILRGAEDAFHDLLDSGNRRLRVMLADARTRPQATREIRQALRGRRTDDEGPQSPPQPSPG